MSDTAPAAADTSAIPGWPAEVDPEAVYRVRLSRPVAVGPTIMTPRQDVSVKGKVLLEIRDGVSRVEA